MVSTLSLGASFACLNPADSDRFLKAIKTVARLPLGVKQSFRCHVV
jgi:hypothetical protein